MPVCVPLMPMGMGMRLASGIVRSVLVLMVCIMDMRMGNLGIVVLNTLIVRLFFPMAAVGLALTAEAKGWGLFQALGAPSWLAILASVILLDLVIYLQHVLVHAVPVLWRLHRMHHADLEFDVTTGARFHPIEILLSMVIKLGTVAALGAPAVAVLIFEVLLNATAMFNHGNVRLPERADRLLRWIVVTPDMHRRRIRGTFPVVQMMQHGISS